MNLAGGALSQLSGLESRSQGLPMLYPEHLRKENVKIIFDERSARSCLQQTYPHRTGH